MKIIEIDKQVYRKRLNIVIIAFIVTFAILAVTFGALLIEMLATDISPNDNLTSDDSNNFKTNLFGVILALIACFAMLHRLKDTEYFKEIYYVWQLKQIHNIIYRRLKKIKSAAKNETNLDVNALIILNYYYVGLKKLYLLDDNTLVLSTLHKNIDELNLILENHSIEVTTAQFDKEMLTSYK